MTIVNRDPFARATLHRRKLYTIDRTCDWCGQRKEDKKGFHFLYRYQWVPDSAAHPLDYFDVRDPAFCSISCMRSYHG